MFPAIIAVIIIVVAAEGFRSWPYRDPGGTWSIGYGSTRDSAENRVVKETPSIEKPEARYLVNRDVTKAAVEVNRSVRVPLTQWQRQALYDLIYNIGVTKFRSSTLLRKLNRGDYNGAAAEFNKWDRAGGRSVPSLLKRRQMETELFLRQ